MKGFGERKSSKWSWEVERVWKRTVRVKNRTAENFSGEDKEKEEEEVEGGGFFFQSCRIGQLEKTEISMSEKALPTANK